MKIRIIPKSQVKRAYEKPQEKRKLYTENESDVDSVDKMPQELFLIISETLKFIKKVDEEDNNEN